MRKAILQIVGKNVGIVTSENNIKFHQKFKNTATVWSSAVVTNIYERVRNGHMHKIFILLCYCINMHNRQEKE